MVVRKVKIEVKIEKAILEWMTGALFLILGVCGPGKAYYLILAGFIFLVLGLSKKEK